MTDTKTPADNGGRASGRYRHITHVMLLLQRSDGRVLTVRHRMSSTHSPGLLTVVGGHLEEGEFAQQAALRELVAGTGAQVAPADAEFCQLVHYLDRAGERSMGVAFTARRWQGEPRNTEPDKHTGLVWVQPGNAPSDCHPYTRTVLANFASGTTLYEEITAPDEAVAAPATERGGAA
ncbi:NUDIX domain-containing protein [Streptomyces flavofungini]|nr:NUDIX domain-containing protein [Streptomyces flavofungini]GHC80257.1 hypothetical protein GCM10010349_62600 [Streptomyces flavofungini]